MKNLLILGLMAFLALTASAANWYVTPSGGGNGSSWSSAATMSGVQSQVAAGDTVWVAGGNYSSFTWSKGGASGNPVLVRRVTASDSVATSAAGWNAGYDSLMSVSGSFTISGSNVILDGRKEYGIKVTTSDSGSASNPINYRAIGMIIYGDNVTLTNIECAGPYTGGAYINALSDSVGWYARSSTYGTGTPINNAVLTHCSVHGFVNLLYPYRAINFLVDHCQIYDTAWANTSCATCVHPNVFADYNSQGTFRFNVVHNWQSEGIMLLGGESNWKIYGNLWYNDTPASSWCIQSQGGGIPNVLIYNNTFVGTALTVISGANGGTWGSGCAGANNIYWNCGGQWAAGWPGDSTSLSGSGSSSPFVSLSGHNFRLAAPHAGTALSSPYNVDMDGNARGTDGTWDIGAYEYGGTPPPVDTTAPTVSISAPGSGAVVSNSVTITGSATDNAGGSGVSTVTFLVDGSSVGTDTASPYTFAWNTTKIANGSHTIQVKATDGAGNVGSSSTITVSVQNVVDTTSPTVALANPVGNTSVSNVVTLTATASDNTGGSGVASVTFYVDGVSAGAVTASPYSVNWDTRTVANGTHTIQARAVDGAGNQASSSTISVTVANPMLTLSDGLLGYWKFDDAQGTTTVDSSGNGNDGTLVGPVTWATGNIGGAISLDGTNGYVRVPSAPALEKVTSAVTLSAWVKIDSTGDMQSILRKVIDENANDLPYAAYDLVAVDNGTSFTPRMGVTAAGSSSRGLALGQSHPYGAWYHLAGVYDGATVRILVNGVEEGSVAYTGSILQTTQPLCIGRFGTVAETVNGLLDEVRLYNRALTATEIGSMLAPPSPPTGLKVIAGQ